jgi:alkylhydroperoxidase family enzyme
VQAALADPATAPISDRLKAALVFLEILATSPAELTSAHVNTVREAGLDQRSIDDLVQVCAIFTIIVRVADALDFEIPSEQVLNRGADIMLRHGYDL